MKVSENLGTLFLGIWLIITGVQDLVNREIPLINELLPLLAVLVTVLFRVRVGYAFTVLALAWEVYPIQALQQQFVDQQSAQVKAAAGLARATEKLAPTDAFNRLHDWSSAALRMAFRMRV